MATLKTILRPLTDCGLPRFTFAGFAFPRYLARLPGGTLYQRFKDRATRALCGEYYHSPAPDNREGRGFYLESDGMPGLRWQWADEVGGARIGHAGWLCDDSQDSKIRGLVFRLPRGRGFLAGWSMGEGMASSVDFSPIFDNERDAALCADSMAENAAESEREHQYHEEFGETNE